MSLDINEVNQNVLRLLERSSNRDDFMIAYTNSVARDATMEYEDGTSKVFPNIEKQKDEFDSWKANTKDETPYLNLLKNPHIQTKDANGNYINFPFQLYAMNMSGYRIIDNTITDVPQEVKDYIAGGLITGQGNVLEIRFTTHTSGDMWLPSNSVSGTFSGGWKWIFVGQGSLNNIQAGEIGNSIETRLNRNWNIDLFYGNFAPSSVVYFAHPFVVAGVVTDVNQVKTLNYNPIQFRFGGEV